MGRRPQGDQPLNDAERSRRKRARQAAKCTSWREVLERVVEELPADHPLHLLAAEALAIKA